MTQPPPPPGFGPPQQPVPYGHPPPGGVLYGGPQPPPPGGRPRDGRRTRRLIVVAAVAAMATIVGAGVWYSGARDGGGTTAAERPGDEAERPGGDGKNGDGAPGGQGREKPPADTAARVAFTLPEPRVEDITDVGGSWATDELFVKPGIRSLAGYGPDGAAAWTLRLPGQVCAASRHQSADGRTAVVFEAAPRAAPRFFQPCTEVGVVDLHTGELLWSASVTSTTGGDAKVAFAEVTQSGNTVAAGGTSGGAAFDLATGAVRWKPVVGSDNCYDRGYAGGPALVAVRQCGEPSRPRLTVQRVDPAGGRPLVSYRLPDGADNASVVSAEPLVVAADLGDTAGSAGFSDLFSVDGKGRQLARISAAGETFAAECGVTEVESCRGIAVGNGRVYLPTVEREGDSEPGFSNTNDLVSYDLATGKPTSDRLAAGDRHMIFPLRMDGGDVIAYRTPSYTAGGQVVSVDGATFAPTTLMRNPADRRTREAESRFANAGDDILYHRGRLYLSATLMNKHTGQDKQLILAYTTAD
ncbi:outer membrane protein assembly factor BamB family protein [Streptomyces yaizuensis]|uniref:PQQ-binding-like beta-propeller repeat protein n=1 Tax=Streptomyces yaizuensis TaxID=2989713 RepID=A0ABQ5P9X0_9ACTN|nr:PQQ-binding-like beta-propeller repeat protein [Streptomyces sp. YSPA8]GLF99394.1 PQQ-binding-like beta-propeller repeat protein [Streptomyces sp. YSPA8]